MDPRRTAGLCGLALALVAGAGLADTLWLENGDRVSGRIKSLDNGVVVVNTPYDRSVRVRWEQVRHVDMEIPATMTLDSGEQTVGRLVRGESGTVLVTTEGKQYQVPLEAFVGIGTSRGAVASGGPAPSGGAWQIRGLGQAGLYVSEGNSENQSAHASLDLAASRGATRYVTELEYQREEREKDSTEDRKQVKLWADRFVNATDFYYVHGDYEHDREKNMRERYSAGVGVGREFIDAEDERFQARLGVEHVWEDVRRGGDEERYAALDLMMNYQRQLTPTLLFYHQHDADFSLEDIGEVFVETETGVRVPLAAGLSGAAQFDYDYDSDPEGRDHGVDRAYRFSLGYEW